MNMFAMEEVNSKKELESLILNTYVSAIVFALVALCIAFAIANIIKWQGKPDLSYIKRRVWWIIIGIVIPVIFWCINAFYVSGFIKGSSKIGDFGKANVLATLICLVGYFVISILLMFLIRSKKWGSILGPSRKYKQ